MPEQRRGTGPGIQPGGWGRAAGPGSPARGGLTREDEGARGGGSWETLRRGKRLPVTSRELQGRQPAWGPRGSGSGGHRGHGVHPHSSDRTSIPQGLQRSVLLAPTALEEAREPSRLGRQDPPWARGLQGDQSSCKVENGKGCLSALPIPQAQAPPPLCALFLSRPAT